MKRINAVVWISLLVLSLLGASPAHAPVRAQTDFSVFLPMLTRMVPANPNVGKIGLGDVHSCAVTPAGGVKCWGFFWVDEGPISIRYVPVTINGFGAPVLTLASEGDHTCALTTRGELLCWGKNESGQLGDGTTETQNTPVKVRNLSASVKAITAGLDYNCALTTAGSVFCWGNNYHGQLGDGTRNERHTPTQLTNLGGKATAISAGWYHTCALMETGGIKCWGLNAHGELGDGTTTSRFAPVDVIGLDAGAIAVSAGANSTCAITSAHAAKCWGENGGQLGNGITPDSSIPEDVIGLQSGTVAISNGEFTNCALTSEGGVKCWGSNQYGLLGTGTDGINSLIPVDVYGLGPGAVVTALDVGRNTACVMLTSGKMMCWGWNGHGGAGTGEKDVSYYTAPANVVNFP